MESFGQDVSQKKEGVAEQKPRSDDVDVTSLVRGFKNFLVKSKNNTSAFVFLILSFVSLILTLLVASKISLGTNIISRFTQMFPLWILFFLTAMLFLSYLAARFNKYKLMFIPIILWILVVACAVRTTNIPQLKDISTGDWTLGPDLDPFLYLRIAQEINHGELRNPDIMRYVPLGTENYALEDLMPWAILLIFKIINLFNNISLTYAAIITPVIFFLISTIGFLLFTKTAFSFKFSNKKAWLGAIIASLFYISSPAMLHRTTAGIPEIESLGLLWFWFMFLFLCLAWKSDSSRRTTIYSVLAGIFTGLMSLTWGGYRYIYMIICLTALIIFLFQKDEKKNLQIFISWIIPALIMEFYRVGDIIGVLTSITTTGFAFFTMFILFVNLIISKPGVERKIKIDKINMPKPIKSLLLGIILLIVLFTIMKSGFILNAFKEISERFLYPFGRGRVGLTVAENKVPFLQEILQNFDYLFWTFVFGTIAVFYATTKNFNTKNKIWLNFAFLFMLAGFVFNKYSPTSLLNGENFISKAFYVGSFIMFAVSIIYILIKAYLRKDDKTLNDFKEVDFSYILLLVFAFWAIASMRGAIRLLVIIAPILPILSAFLFIKLLDSKTKSKDMRKTAIIIMLIVVTGLFFVTFVHYYEITNSSTKSTIPGAYEQQWQKAMAWVRGNTPEGSVFVHWWDYGYWVQTIGERPTVTDGGHPISYWDHLIGRYVLTTPYPETALSFMKAHKVSYLLIDSSDIGKYSAYSSIGSDTTGQDRFSWIPVMISDPKQVQETSNGTLKVYGGGFGLDKDIIYDMEGKKIFLPSGSAGIGAVIVQTKNKNDSISFAQPEGIFVYNGNQIRIPIRYLYYNERMLDFKSGLNITIDIIPSISSTGGGYQIDKTGSIIYLSEKTMNSLVSQLYLLNDPFKRYPTVTLAHSEDDSFVSFVNGQGANVKDFVYFNGLRGPIKMWKVDYPENIATKDEFLRTSGGYGEFDNLTFTK
ncbi:hypothetical protein HY212_06930 [Candidatus Pacearchaeota archaeon]|nr:hypothetical protein [Candidatus Pacearchaeota archaeon]